MRDIDIRKKLHQILNAEHENDPSTKIIDEFHVSQGLARVDVAVINGTIHGFEIKSDSDTLNRLPHQVEYYNKSFNYVTLVVHQNYYSKVKSIIPKWWGITEVSGNEMNPIFSVKRKHRLNKSVDSNELLKLLWKDELQDIIKEQLFIKINKPKNQLREILLSNFASEQIQLFVRTKIKDRALWRVD